MDRNCWDRHGHGAGRGGRGWGFDPSGGGAWFWGGPGRGRGGPFRRGRMFEQGDLKYVILRLLAEKPRHGYEIIKELEDRFSGAYAPSAGTVYPTLTLLEDLGYATVTPQEGGKKVYSITPEGEKYLEENKGAVEDIFERISEFGSSFLSESVMDLNKAVGRIMRATYTTVPWQSGDKSVISEIKRVLEQAAAEIEEIGRRKPAGS
jgi:DNA-binding PadR family transcriptional regulator